MANQPATNKKMTLTHAFFQRREAVVFWIVSALFSVLPAIYFWWGFWYVMAVCVVLVLASVCGIYYRRWEEEQERKEGDERWLMYDLNPH